MSWRSNTDTNCVIVIYDNEDSDGSGKWGIISGSDIRYDWISFNVNDYRNFTINAYAQTGNISVSFIGFIWEDGPTKYYNLLEEDISLFSNNGSGDSVTFEFDYPLLTLDEDFEIYRNIIINPTTKIYIFYSVSANAVGATIELIPSSNISTPPTYDWREDTIINSDFVVLSSETIGEDAIYIINDYTNSSTEKNFISFKTTLLRDFTIKFGVLSGSWGGEYANFLITQQYYNNVEDENFEQTVDRIINVFDNTVSYTNDQTSFYTIGGVNMWGIFYVRITPSPYIIYEQEPIDYYENDTRSPCPTTTPTPTTTTTTTTEPPCVPCLPDPDPYSVNTAVPFTSRTPTPITPRPKLNFEGNAPLTPTFVVTTTTSTTTATTPTPTTAPPTSSTTQSTTKCSECDCNKLGF